jgi:hypothetical protein
MTVRRGKAVMASKHHGEMRRGKRGSRPARTLPQTGTPTAARGNRGTARQRW